MTKQPKWNEQDYDKDCYCSDCEFYRWELNN